MSVFLAYIPFVHPINFFHELWYFLLLPLAFGIAVIYKAVRIIQLEHYWREVAIMSTQIVISMIALAVALTILIQFLIPLIPVE